MSEFFNNFKKIFTTIFPPVIIPQKRYIILGITIIYLITKQIVLLTPNKIDDELLQEIHDAAFQLVQNDNKNIPDNS